jgi:hypothetical protein
MSNQKNPFYVHPQPEILAVVQYHYTEDELETTDCDGDPLPEDTQLRVNETVFYDENCLDADIIKDGSDNPVIHHNRTVLTVDRETGDTVSLTLYRTSDGKYFAVDSRYLDAIDDEAVIFSPFRLGNAWTPK